MFYVDFDHRGTYYLEKTISSFYVLCRFRALWDILHLYLDLSFTHTLSLSNKHITETDHLIYYIDIYKYFFKILSNCTLVTMIF